MFKRIWEEYQALAPKPPDPETPAATFDSEDTEPIAQLVLSLPRKDHVRHLAVSLLAGCGGHLPDASPLVSAVISSPAKHWRRAAVAAWCLGRVRLSDEERKFVADRLCAVVDSRIPFDHLGVAFNRVFKVCGVITGLIALSLLAVTMPEWISRWDMILAAAAATVVGGGLLFLLLSGVVIGPILIPCSVTADKARVNRVRAQAAETLGELGRPESVDALAVAARESGPRVRGAAQESLIRILPRVTEHHRGLLSAQTVPNLCRLLDDSDDARSIAILHALERVGDGRAVKPVQNAIIRWSFRSPNSSVQNEAERILARLLQWQRQEQASSMLLRAADRADDQVLVRPAISIPSEDSATLVRPADSGA